MRALFLNICILLLCFTFSANADEVTEVRGEQALFSLDGLEDIAVGDNVEIFDGDISVGKGKITKIGKKSALATVSQSSQPIQKGQKVKISKFDKLLNAENKSSTNNKEQKNYQYGHKWIAEPFANIVTGSLEQNISVTSPVTGTANVEGSISGFQLGARGGYIWENFYFGGQYSLSSGRHKELKLIMNLADSTTTETVPDMDYDKSDFGFLIGWRFGEMFRMWFSALNSSLKTKASDGEVTKYKGSTGILGFGWHVGYNVSINLEIGGAIYSEEDGRKYPFSVTSDGTTMNVDAFKETYALFGISWCHGLY